jgi:hypothetical protein
MELTEPIESINKQLIDLFGIDTQTSQPIFRVVWSEDQFERRATDRTDSGIQLMFPEFRILPKYRQWIHEKFVLERLVIIPEENVKELAGVRVSYEPLWVFKSENEQYVPPTVWACKFVIDTLYAALGKQSLAKYIDEEAKHPQEAKEKRIAKLTEELFGDESDLLGRTITGEAIAMPQSYKIAQEEGKLC